MDIEDVEVFIGIDVGKAEHWATALTGDGKKLFDKALPNSEDRLREVYEQLMEHGRLLVVVDQPATIGALAVAVAQDMGITVGYLPGLSMRRIADLTPGSAKTDAKDAAVIADAARTMPHTLRSISTSDEDAAALSMLTGFDLDLARQVNQTANRIRGLYTQIHPALETVLGKWLEHDSVLEVIAAWPTPARL
ncbi:transposase, partial [Actinomyces sp. Z3]|uniref:IS110 family transposase n=1 Tax=Actinomyces sp. Z3 TaxID=2250217 RepID=UPI000DCC7FCD